MLYCVIHDVYIHDVYIHVHTHAKGTVQNCNVGHFWHVNLYNFYTDHCVLHACMFWFDFLLCIHVHVRICMCSVLPVVKVYCC